MDNIAGGITVLLIFVGLSTPIIVLFLYLYLKKRLEHKQIMAAIEKGIAPSTIPAITIKPSKPTSPLWIKNLTAGIALLIIAAGLAIIPLIHHGTHGESGNSIKYLIFALIAFAIGISYVIRGILQKQAEKQLPNNRQDAAPN
jgi:hypothetical protein